jgi:hypothetical protein
VETVVNLIKYVELFRGNHLPLRHSFYALDSKYAHTFHIHIACKMNTSTVNTVSACIQTLKRGLNKNALK